MAAAVKWFQTHVYLAAWLSPIVAIIAVLVRNARHEHHIDSSRLMIYVAFLTCLAVSVTPTFDEGTRSFARGFVYAGLGFLIVDRART